MRKDKFASDVWVKYAYLEVSNVLLEGRMTLSTCGICTPCAKDKFASDVWVKYAYVEVSNVLLEGRTTLSACRIHTPCAIRQVCM